MVYEASLRKPASGARWRVLTAALAALLGAAPALAAPPAAAPPTVPTVVVGTGAAGTGFEIDGALEALQQSTVAAQLGGNVLQLAVEAGDRVKAGQLLARIDERDAQAGLARTDAALAQAQAELSNARLHAERTRDLRSQGFVSQAAQDVADTQLKAAQAGVQQAQSGRSQAALARSFAAVTAPFDAIVLATHVEAGELAAPGRPLVTLYAPGRMRAVVQLPASRTAAARGASGVQVQLPGGADSRWVTPAARTELPGTDPVSQTVEWRLDLSAVDSAGLTPGQNVRVRFAGAPAAAATAAAPGRLTVPAAAVLRRGELTGVYAAQDSRFVLKAVRLGAAQGGDVEVLAGLKPGERVALDPVRAGLAGAVPAAQ
jgi:RND family efflux transporter MFP subunit